MANPRRTAIRIERSITLNATQYWCVLKLQETGLWGNSASDVINRLIDAQLRDIVADAPQLFEVSNVKSAKTIKQLEVLTDDNDPCEQESHLHLSCT